MSCEWINDPEGVVIKGHTIKRGFFYLGEGLPIYKRKLIKGDLGRKTRIQYFDGPVINPSLKVSEAKSRKQAVTSYTDMDPYQRLLLLRWLSGEASIVETPATIIAYYLWGIYIRVLFDDECKKKEVEAISKFIKGLREECDLHRWKSKSDIIEKLELLQSYLAIKHYPGKRHNYKHFYHVLQNLVIEKVALSHISTLEEAYDIWYEYFSHDKGLGRFAGSTLREWWKIACETVTSGKQSSSGVVATLKLSFRDIGEGVMFHPTRTSLDTTLLRYSDEAARFFAQLCKCNREFCECYRRHRAGLPVRKPTPKARTTKATGESSFRTPKASKPFIIPLEAILSPAEIGARKLRAKLPNDFQFMSIKKIMEEAGYGKPAKQVLMSKLKELYKGFLSEGLGMAPSSSFINMNYQIDDELVVFKREAQDKYEPDYLYDFIDVFLKLAAYISQGFVTERERIFIMNFISSKDKRSGNQKQLFAYFLWYLRNIRTINSEIKESISNDLNARGRESIAKHLIEYVESDLDTMFAKEHLLPNVLPILTSKQFSISAAKRNEALVTIDLNKLGKIKQDTQVAQSFLSDIFIEDEETVVTEKSNDFKYADILAEILSKDSWNRTELSNLSKKRGLILGSLLEKINDYSYSKVDDAVIEDNGDMLYVNVEYKKELL